MSSNHRALGIDLDEEPLRYGLENHWMKLKPGQKRRLEYRHANVLDSHTPKCDIVLAFNFSYLIFKSRPQLLAYFRSAREGLKSDGVFFCDLLGGPECQTVMTETTDYRHGRYLWDLTRYDPITNDVRFSIHFKRKGCPLDRNVFCYDWRLWTVPEVRELLKEAGFKRSVVYWEEDGRDGRGNGVFYPVETVENCDAWVVYIAALK